MLRQTPEQAAAVAKRVHDEAVARDAETNAILAKARGGMSPQQIAQNQSEVTSIGSPINNYSNQQLPNNQLRGILGQSMYWQPYMQGQQAQSMQYRQPQQGQNWGGQYGYGNQGMFGGTATTRTPYTNYQQYQPYGGQNYSSGMFGAPVANNWQAGNTQQQNQSWSQNNPYSMRRW